MAFGRKICVGCSRILCLMVCRQAPASCLLRTSTRSTPLRGALLADIVQTGKPVIVLLTSRTESIRGHVLQRVVDIVYIKLKPLDEADTAEFVSASLNQADIPLWLQQAICSAPAEIRSSSARSVG